MTAKKKAPKVLAHPGAQIEIPNEEISMNQHTSKKVSAHEVTA